MKISIGSDHAGYNIKEKIKQHLTKQYECIDMGCFNENRCDYPDIAKLVCESVNSDNNNNNENNTFGILVCGSGIGMSISANRFSHIRCALCNTTELAKLSRMHNNSNILAIGARLTDETLIYEIIKIFLNTNFEGGRHQERINKLSI